MPTCATYRPQQSLTAFQSWSVGVCNAGIRCTHVYSYNTTQTSYTQCNSTSGEPSLIHMNGHAYASGLQRFLSPDPVLQAPANAQSHNRYAYCLNTPLRYTDPSGYIHAPAVPRWPEGYDPPDHVDDPWGGSSGWARAMTPGMTYGWWAGLPAAAYGPAYYAYFGSDGSRNAPPSSHFDHVYGAGGERGRVEWKYRWESKPGKIQADGGIEVIGYKEWYMEWTPAGGDVRQNRSDGVWTVGATATVAAGLLGVKIAIGLAISRETIRPYVTIEHAIGVDVSAGIEIEHYISLYQNKISVSELKGWSESTNIGLWIMDGTIGGDVKKGGLLLQDRVEWVPQNNYNVFGIGFSIGSPFGFTRNKGYTWIW